MSDSPPTRRRHTSRLAHLVLAAAVIMGTTAIPDVPAAAAAGPATASPTGLDCAVRQTQVGVESITYFTLTGPREEAMPVYRVDVPLSEVQCVQTAFTDVAEALHLSCTSGAAATALLGGLAGVLLGGPAGVIGTVPGALIAIHCSVLRNDLLMFARHLAAAGAQCAADGFGGISYTIRTVQRERNGIESYIDLDAGELSCFPGPGSTGQRTTAGTQAGSELSITLYSSQPVVEPTPPPPGRYDLVVTSTDERRCVGSPEICDKFDNRPVTYHSQSVQSFYLDPKVESGRKVPVAVTISAQPGCTAPPRPREFYARYEAHISETSYDSRYLHDTYPWKTGTQKRHHHYLCRPGTAIGAWYTTIWTDEMTFRARLQPA